MSALDIIAIIALTFFGIIVYQAAYHANAGNYSTKINHVGGIFWTVIYIAALYQIGAK